MIASSWWPSIHSVNSVALDCTVPYHCSLAPVCSTHALDTRSTASLAAVASESLVCSGSAQLL